MHEHEVDAMDDLNREEDPTDWMRVDGNAVAGALMEWFGVEMTAASGECNHCGNVAAVATLHAYVRGPGIVLRCSLCHEVTLRLVHTPRGSFLDARGTAWLSRPPSAPGAPNPEVAPGPPVTPGPPVAPGAT